MIDSRIPVALHQNGGFPPLLRCRIVRIAVIPRFSVTCA